MPTRELNDSVTQEWQNGNTELLPQDNTLIQGTSLPQLLQTSLEHKLAWLAQIRLARQAYASTQDGDESTDIDSETLETTQRTHEQHRVFSNHYLDTTSSSKLRSRNRP
jgi:hypothetical protein